MKRYVCEVCGKEFEYARRANRFTLVNRSQLCVRGRGREHKLIDRFCREDGSIFNYDMLEPGMMLYDFIIPLGIVSYEVKSVEKCVPPKRKYLAEHGLLPPEHANKETIVVHTTCGYDITADGTHKYFLTARELREYIINSLAKY